MARLRPSWLFRRLSSRDSKDTSKSSKSHRTTDSSASPPPLSASSPPPDLPQTPKTAAYSLATPSPTSKKPRKSRSLPKLRKKFNSQGTADLDVPESVEEKRESVLVPDDRVEKQAGSCRDSGQRTPYISTEELTLDQGEIASLRKNPQLIVEEATPEVKAATGRGSGE